VAGTAVPTSATYYRTMLFGSPALALALE
jgi:hypothetical protein